MTHARPGPSPVKADAAHGVCATAGIADIATGWASAAMMLRESARGARSNDCGRDSTITRCRLWCCLGGAFGSRHPR